MSDVIDNVTKVASKISELQAKREQHLANAAALEAQAREERKLAADAKTDMASLHTVLAAEQVKARILTEEQAAKAITAKAKSDADAHAVEMARQHAELDELIKKAREALPPAAPAE